MNGTTSVWARFAAMSAVLLSAMGCADIGGYGPPSPVVTGTPPPFPCAVVKETSWDKFDFGADGPDEVEGTVVKMWAIDKAQVQQLEAYPEEHRHSVQVRWESADGSAKFIARFREGGLQTITIVLSSDAALTQILDCLGDPGYYAAYTTADVEDAFLSLSLWYEERGLAVFHESLVSRHSDEAPLLKPALRVALIEVVESGDPEAVVAAAHDWEGPDKRDFVLCVLKPWPGSIEAMEFEVSLYGNPLPSACEEETQ